MDYQAMGQSSDRESPAESRLAHLSAATGPLRHALAAIAARLLETRAYEPLCYARIGDYARERAGLSARQLHDLAHVHRTLAALPSLERALLANELPWSKVRLVARVAAPADEEAWLARARVLPIRRLEAAVRASASSGPPAQPDDDLPRTRLTVRCTLAVREKWRFAHEMAERVAGQRLRADEALEWVTAEACSGAAIDPTREPDPELCWERWSIGAVDREDAADQSDDAGGARPLPALELPAITSLRDGLDEADPVELDRRLRLAVRLEQTLDAAIAPLLRVVTSAGYEWCGPSYLTLATYATEHLGMSASKARALLRIERAGDICPELREAFRAGRLSWAKAQCLLPLLLLDVPGEWRPRWVAWAERVTVRRLESDVERALLLRAGTHFAWQRCKYHPEQAQDPVPDHEQQMCAQDVDTEATETLHWRVPHDVAWLFRAAHAALCLQLRSRGLRHPSGGQAFEAMIDHAIASWSRRDPDGPRPDPVIERDGYRCAVPGCSSRRNLHDHHIVFRSAGGSNAPDNRITLCAFHHHRCLHAGRLRVRGQAPDHLVFELGVLRGGTPLARYRSGDIAVGLHYTDALSCRKGRSLPALPASAAAAP